MEYILIRSIELSNFKTEHYYGNDRRDTVAQQLLGPVTKGTALHVSGNGDCLFNSASVLLYRSEEFSTELRVWYNCVQYGEIHIIVKSQNTELCVGFWCYV